MYDLGKSEYEVLHPNAVAWDLNQDPCYRCKKSGPILSTLTTGCSHFWLKASNRCLTGLELMALHSIPICESLAKAMGSTQVDVSQVSNTARCFLNSMHCASVGTVVAIALLCTRITKWAWGTCNVRCQNQNYGACMRVCVQHAQLENAMYDRKWTTESKTPK